VFVVAAATADTILAGNVRDTARQTFAGGHCTTGYRHDNDRSSLLQRTLSRYCLLLSVM